MKPLRHTLHIAWLVLSRALLVYAIAFSLVGTVFVVRVLLLVRTPVRAVQALRTTQPDLSAFMQQHLAQLRTEGLADSLEHRYVPLDSISPHLVATVVAAEDDAFYTHPGFDVVSILAAAEQNRVRNKLHHGGSTITQQVAKNFFLSGERTYERKFAELAYALLLERFLGKERILELYLNYAQWGETVFGAEAAAQHYFGKSAARLDLAESARLAATLAMPEKIDPRRTRSSFMARRLLTIAGNLYYRRLIDDTAYTALCGAPPPGTSDSSGLRTANGAGAVNDTLPPLPSPRSLAD